MIASLFLYGSGLFAIGLLAGLYLHDEWQRGEKVDWRDALAAAAAAVFWPGVLPIFAIYMIRENRMERAADALRNYSSNGD